MVSRNSWILVAIPTITTDFTCRPHHRTGVSNSATSFTHDQASATKLREAKVSNNESPLLGAENILRLRIRQCQHQTRSNNNIKTISQQYFALNTKSNSPGNLESKNNSTNLQIAVGNAA